MAKIGIVVALCVLACGGSKKKEAAAGADDSLPPEIAKWMPADADKLVQGIWQTHISFFTNQTLDAPAALEITGETAHASDGKVDHALSFAISSPCEFTLTEKLTDGKMAGGTASYTKHFLAAGGKLVAVGDGAAGYRKGKDALVCQLGAERLITADASGCKSWTQDFMDKKKWDSKPTPCAWSTKDGKDMLTIGKPDDEWKHELAADGDLLWTDQLQREVKEQRYMTKAPDFATAKAWVDAELKTKQ